MVVVATLGVGGVVFRCRKKKKKRNIRINSSIENGRTIDQHGSLGREGNDYGDKR